MKKIDILLLKSFTGPFFAAFFIGCFALVLQTLWLYVDEIVGRGVGLFVVAEVVFYSSIAVFVLAIPIGVLLASVMVIGNMGEKYELSSFKSAGVPLLRILRPLIFVSVGLACFSYLNSNFIFPVAQLKIKSRLYDLKKTKPTLALDEKVFNDDFSDFTIYIDKKSANGKDIENVLIYDHRNISKQINLTTAERGEIFLANEDKYMIMRLYNGTRYEELSRSRDNGAYPFMRSSFSEYTLTFPLEEFGMKSTNPELFRHHEFLNNIELLQAIDSIATKIDRRSLEFQKQHTQRYSFFKARETLIESQLDSINTNKTTSETEADSLSLSDSIANQMMDTMNLTSSTADSLKDSTSALSYSPVAAGEALTTDQKYRAMEAARPKKKQKEKGNTIFVKKQILDKPLEAYDDLGQTFERGKQERIYQVAQQYCASIISFTKAANFSLDKQERLKRKHVYQFHSQFTMALICIVFMFIGGSMGALVRKGGFGFPILIAISFFILFLMIEIFCKKNNKAGTADPVLLAWMPLLILTPICYFLTKKAINDSKLFDTSGVKEWFSSTFKRLKNEKS